MILHTQPLKPWNEHDFLLLEAYQILEDERCPQCGMPVYICHNESSTVQFRIEEDQCAALVTKERHEKSRSKKKNYEPPAGTVLRPVPFMTNGLDLVTLREPYYEAEAAKRAAIEGDHPES